MNTTDSDRLDAPFRDELTRYFQGRFGAGVAIVATEWLGKEGGAKGFGYGAPLRVTLRGAPVAAVVIHAGGTGGFGHDTLADRAAEAMLAYETFNNLPEHVRALDVGAMARDGAWISLGGAARFFVVTEYGEGEPYFRDLERLAGGGELTTRDRERVDALASYLATIHGDRREEPELYRRRARDLFGHHECIAGLLDSYDGLPLNGFTSASELEAIEQRCVAWRRRLKQFTHRLCRVHGDFHPWNVLWPSGAAGAPILLDRSRGEWGEAADDVSSMAINYLFFALQAHGRVEGALGELWERFFTWYLNATGDEELLQVIPPFFVWRALVIASPLWYPRLDVTVRRALFQFIDRLLTVETFDWRSINHLLTSPRPRVPASPRPAPTGGVLWITGRPASGKSTLAEALRAAFAARGVRATVIDSDEMRRVVTPEPRYTAEERALFYRAMAYAAKRLADEGSVAIVAATAHEARYREWAKAICPHGFLLYARCPLAVCEARDPKGLYRQARGDGATTLPGVGVAFEEPADADAVVDTDGPVAAERVEAIVGAFLNRGV